MIISFYELWVRLNTDNLRDFSKPNLPMKILAVCLIGISAIIAYICAHIEFHEDKIEIIEGFH